ncbi:DUF6086 family protein [Streptomyces sp. NPDC002812]|uniref:DUF6086 family protein n=1 Tax=Streptomyces sp. NPDC002812 TaxID=3154434 RepID=UPI003316C7F5
MSQYYEVGDETLWNPASGAARLFHRQVALFEEELGLPSGIGPMEMDECQIDPAALGVFTEALVARHGHAGHAVIRALSEGFVTTVLVLAERAGVGDLRVPPLPGSYEASAEDALRAAARELSGRMPR